MNIHDKIKLSANTAIISGVFCVVVALLLLLNYWQLSKNDPLESQTMQILVERLGKEPNNEELKQDIRQLDLLARKAYFNTHWQIKTGGILLLVGGIIFAVALRFYYSLKAKIEVPEQKTENEIVARLLTQRWLIIAGAGIMALALIASLATTDYLKLFDTVQETAEAPRETESGIEVIEVGETPVVVASSTETAETPAEIESAPEIADEEKVTEASAQQPETATETKPAAPVFPDAAQLRANHPSFRGAFGTGISVRKNIPVDFDIPAGKGLLWKTEVSLPGYNSPVIWGNRVFLSGADGSQKAVYCIDRNSGKILWTQAVTDIQGSPATPPKTTEDTGLAAPSVVTDGIRVYAIFGTGDLICFDMDGNRVWAKNLGVPDNHYGHSSSLIAWQEKLYIQYDTNKSRKLIALNTENGETIWETERNVKVSWASPILIQVGGKYQVVLAADPHLAGYDAETGKELWTAKGLMGEVGPSPAFGERLVFATQEYATLMAVNPANGEVVWQDSDYMSEVSSPVAAGGLVFLATSYGVLVCYDAKTGEKLWEHDSGVGYYSSPIVADNKVFLFDLDGLCQVFAVSREMELIAESPTGEKISATPAFADGRMYIRAGKTVYCIGN